MDLIKTTSFKLSVNMRGDINANKMALLLPGRLDSKDYINFDKHLEYFKSLGFFAVVIDPPGTWDSPGGIELYTTSNYIKSVHEVIKYYGNKQTILLGHSRGAAVAAICGAANNFVKGVVMIMPPFGNPQELSTESVKSGIYMSYRDLPPGDKKTEIKKEFALPIQYFTDTKKYDVVKIFKTCKKPKLVIYGENDEFIPRDRVIEISRGFLDPKIIQSVNSGHNYRYCPEIIVEINHLIGDFIKASDL